MTLTPTLTLTLHLIDAEQAIRRRVPGGVNLAVAQGRPTSPSIDPDEAKRGPGMYDLSQNAVLPSPKATDFSKAQGRPLDEHRAGPSTGSGRAAWERYTFALLSHLK